MLSVLIAEDHQAVREALSEAFLGWGYKVFSASSLQEAIDFTARNSFDLVVTDVDLGGASGLELVRTLGTSNPKITFIVISGRFGSKDLLHSGLEMGKRLKYLKKPFLLSDLQAAVAEVEKYKPSSSS